MRIRCAGALALSLLLLLASTVGLVGHDHAAETERAGYDCALDHERDPGARAQDVATLHAGGEQHRHHCLGCQHGGQRILLAASQGVDTLHLDDDETSRIRARPLASASWSGRTLRGPPPV